MSNIFIEMTQSLDGYVAKKGPLTLEAPFGPGGDRIHDWMFDNKTPEDEKIHDELWARIGAVIGGATTYELGIESGWEGKNPYSSPFFVVTHKAPTKQPKGFTFVTDGIESALTQAQKAAGEKDVLIMGGANLARQYLKAGLVDELVLHIVPLIFGNGRSLLGELDTEIELEHTGKAIQTPGAIHAKYKIL
jgi:dihydrofolate reductase